MVNALHFPERGEGACHEGLATHWGLLTLPRPFARGPDGSRPGVVSCVVGTGRVAPLMELDQVRPARSFLVCARVALGVL